MRCAAGRYHIYEHNIPGKCQLCGASVPNLAVHIHDMHGPGGPKPEVRGSRGAWTMEGTRSMFGENVSWARHALQVPLTSSGGCCLWWPADPHWVRGGPRSAPQVRQQVPHGPGGEEKGRGREWGKDISQAAFSTTLHSHLPVPSHTQEFAGQGFWVPGGGSEPGERLSVGAVSVRDDSP